MPDFALETEALNAGYALVAGVDEAGRGPLAGPVVAAAVILSADSIPAGLNDSKKLTAARREQLSTQLFAQAHVCVVSAPPQLIERFNIRGATLWAMRQAVTGLATRPQFALIDGRDIPTGLPCPAQFVIGGDAKSLSIAAASIVAKVARDRMCQIMDAELGQYGFARHKGYGTKAHMEALEDLGASQHHRRAFAPVKKALTFHSP